MVKKIIFFIILSLVFVFRVEAGVQPLPAETAFVLSARVDQNQALQLQWSMPAGYYLYRDKIKIEQEPSSVQKIGAIDLPIGVIRKDILHSQYQAYFNQLSVSVPLQKPIKGKLILKIAFQGCSQDGFCYPPMTRVLKLSVAQLQSPQDLTQYLVTSQHGEIGASNQGYFVDLLHSQHYGYILLSFVLLGVLLAFTPCVLPMIPILSGIIVGYGKVISTRKAFMLSLFYVLGMALAYALAGILVALVGSHIQQALQQPAFIIAFSGLFVLLALSLFDWYEITLPHRIHKQIVHWSSRHEGGTYFGVFCMGALSTLIISPCVSAPLVGVLAYIGESGDIALGGVSLMALGIGMGIPLLLIGTAGGRLIPKTGSWMVRIKQFFGLLMLGIAIWLVGRVLSAEVSAFLWGMLAFGVAWYLWKIKHSHIAWRLVHQGFFWMVLSFAFIIMGNIFFGQPNLYVVNHLLSLKPTYEKLPFTLVKTQADLDGQLFAAKVRHKKVLLDFYADWCVACIVMDKKVFSNPEIKQALANYVLLRADVTKNNTFDQAVQKQYQVYAPPAMIFINGNGDEEKKYEIAGEVGSQSVLAELQMIEGTQPVCLADNSQC